MNTAVKVGLVVGGLWIAGKLVTGAKKAGNLKNNLYVTSKVKDLDPGWLNSVIKLEVGIENISGFSLTVKNLFTKVYYTDKAGNKTEIGHTNIVPSVSMANNQTSPFSLNLQASNIEIAKAAAKAQKIEVVTWYEYLGQQLSYPSEITLADFRQIVKQKLGLGAVTPQIDQNSPLCLV